MSDNPSAFPNTGNSTWGLKPQPGMTLRDWFAGQALAGILADSDNIARHSRIAGKAGALRAVGAEIAYEYADAMLEARQSHGGLDHG